MGLTTLGWKNKKGTGGRSCKCGSWKNHWLNFSKKSWPATCSVADCNNSATLGAHIFNSNVPDEYIVPICDRCNKLGSEFNLKGGITLVPANRTKTCEK